MKYISLFFYFLVGCSVSNMYEKGDVYALRINTVENYDEFKRKAIDLERIIGIKKLSSYNQVGLHVFYFSTAVDDVYYFFIPKKTSSSSFYINNIHGINACGVLSLNEAKQKKIFNYGVEEFPYLNIYRNGKFPLKGEKQSYNQVVGYRLYENNERKYFSYYIYSEASLNKSLKVGFPQYPSIIAEYEDFIKTVGETVSTEVSRNVCLHYLNHSM